MYEPELGQFAFGQPWQEYGLPDSDRGYVSARLVELTQAIFEKTDDKEEMGFGLVGSYDYGIDFRNNVFSMFPYYWGDTCAEEDKECDGECLDSRPNFKCGAVEVNWYKYIGRGMSVNRPVSRKEWRDIFNKCFKSLE